MTPPSPSSPESSPPLTPARILLVDDHAVLREGLRYLLDQQEDLEVVGEASNGWEALEKIQTLRPDLVLMDIAMPEMDGLEATRRIKAAAPETRVLVLTQHDNREYVLPLLQAGASGYVLKRSGGREVINAIRQVLQHGLFLEASVTQQLVEGMTALAGHSLKQTQQAQAEQTHPHLTGRELQVLHLLMKGMSNKEIAHRIGISPKTVSVHRSNMMMKLGVSNAIELIRYAEKAGLLDDSAAPEFKTEGDLNDGN